MADLAGCPDLVQFQALAFLLFLVGDHSHHPGEDEEVDREYPSGYDAEHPPTDSQLDAGQIDPYDSIPEDQGEDGGGHHEADDQPPPPQRLQGGGGRHRPDPPAYGSKQDKDDINREGPEEGGQ